MYSLSMWCRARTIWIALLATLLAYTLWIVVSAVQARENPATSVEVKDEHYPFPDVSVCMLEEWGCDNPDYVSWCAYSTFEYDLRHHAYVVDGFESEPENITAKYSETFDNCVEFKLSSLAINEARLYDEGFEPIVVTTVQWLVAYNQSWVPSSYTDAVTVSLYDGDEGIANNSPSFALPYNRINYTDILTSVSSSDLSMSLTETKYLSGEQTKRYSVDSATQWTYTLEDLSVAWIPTLPKGVDGLLHFYLKQPKLSHTFLEEIDPLSIPNIIASIGAAWQILIIAWGLVFIASRRGPPDLKGRNFKKSVRRTTKALVDGARSVAGSGWRPNKRGPSRVDPSEETRPEWDNGNGASASAHQHNAPEEDSNLRLTSSMIANDDVKGLELNKVSTQNLDENGRTDTKKAPRFAPAYGCPASCLGHQASRDGLQHQASHHSADGSGVNPSASRPVIVDIPGVATRPVRNSRRAIFAAHGSP